MGALPTLKLLHTLCRFSATSQVCPCIAQVNTRSGGPTRWKVCFLCPFMHNRKEVTRLLPWDLLAKYSCVKKSQGMLPILLVQNQVHYQEWHHEAECHMAWLGPWVPEIICPVHNWSFDYIYSTVHITAKKEVFFDSIWLPQFHTSSASLSTVETHCQLDIPKSD